MTGFALIYEIESGSLARGAAYYQSMNSQLLGSLGQKSKFIEIIMQRLIQFNDYTMDLPLAG